MPESIIFSVDFPVSPERVYRAWLDSYEHSQFTGQPAQISGTPGQAYSSLGNLVRGKIVSASPFDHIVQTWATSDFPQGAPASQVDLRLEPTCNGSLVTLRQTGIPEGYSHKVMEIWEKAYFRPLKAFFDEIVGDTAADMDG